MAKKSLKLVKMKKAIDLVNHEVNLLGIILERREPKPCRTGDWICTLRIIDDSYPSPGLTVNVFSSHHEYLPHIKNLKDMILFTHVKMKYFKRGETVNVVYDKRHSSFALYEVGTSNDFVCYQCSLNFDYEARQYKSSIHDLAKLVGSSSIIDEVLESAYTVEDFSFLRDIKEGKCFDSLCKVLHINEDTRTIFIWDGTDAPPASIPANGIEDKEPFSSLSAHTLLSRDILRSFPTVGTILRVSLSSHLLQCVKPGEWVKLYYLLCHVDKGCWIGKATDATKVYLAQNEPLVEEIMRVYNKRISTEKIGGTPFWSFPLPGLTETDHDEEPFVTLMDIITYPKVTYKYKCIVRVVDAYPRQVEDLFSNEKRSCRVLLTLEDPTASLDVFLSDKDAEYFFGGIDLENTEMLKKKLNRLLGISESSSSESVAGATRSPPWIEVCMISYYRVKADPWKTRFYRIFNTRLLD